MKGLEMERFERQATLVPAEKLAEQDIWIVGCGAVGRNVALQLASMGARKLTLVDFDSVEPTNITTQGWRIDQLGLPKVAALEEDIKKIDHTIEVATHNRRWHNTDGLGTVGFICVDSISIREFIWSKVGIDFTTPSVLIDTRTLGEMGKVLAAHDRGSIYHYSKSFFREEDTEPGLCTARMTIYSAMFAASMACHQFARWVRGGEPDHEVVWSMLASEMDVPELKKRSKIKPAKPRVERKKITKKTKNRR